MAGRRNIKCSACEHSKWLPHFEAWTCSHPECKDVPIFRGITHPHCCPLIGGKKYFCHRNHKPTIEVRLPLRG